MDETVGRALWLDERRKGIGGTDAAAILGLSRFSTPFQVWLAKKGEAAPRVENDAMWWGNALEPLIAARFAASEPGREVWKPTHPDGRARLLAHPEHPCLIGSVDFLLRSAPRGLECKTSRRDDDEWGEPGTDQVPAAYIIQCQHYMAITGYRVWYLAALISGNDFRVYRIDADDDLQGTIVERCVAWWDRHIVRDVRPPIDGDEETRRWLAHRFPQNTRPLVAAPPEALALAEDLALARETARTAEERSDAISNALREIIGDADGVEAPSFRATWKKAKDSKHVDWEAAARHLAALNPDLTDGVIEQYTSTRPGSRRFLFKWKGVSG